MAITEEITHYFRRGNLLAISLDTSMAHQDQLSFFTCPRNMKAEAIRIRGYVLPAVSIGASSRSMQLWLVPDSLVTGVLPTDSLTFRPLWTLAMNHFIAGTPTNTFREQNPSVIREELDKRFGLRNTGPSSTRPVAWKIYGIASDTYSMLVHIELDIKLTWLNETGPTKDMPASMLDTIEQYIEAAGSF